MIKRLILSIAIITGVAASAFSGTKAVLSDTTSLTANNMTTGTVNLQISKSTSTAPTTFTDSVAGFSDQVKPGETKSFQFWLKNTGDVALSLAGQTPPVSVQGGVTADKVIVSFTPISDSGAEIAGAPTATASLAAWTDGVLPFNGFSPTYNLAAGAKQRFRMDVKFDSSISSPGSANFDFVFTGNQM